MFNPFEYSDDVLWELSDPNLDMEDQDYADFIKDEDYFSELDSNGEKPQSMDTLFHEMVKKAQQNRAKISGELIPSKAKSVYWLYAESTIKKKKPTKNSGKWLIFAPPDQIDAAWEQVKDATQRGLLGAKSKVSTLKGFRGKEFVICVYTPNWKDEVDVMKVREALRELGFEKPLPYKSDSDTLAGKYQHKGDKNISKYYI